MTIDHALAAAQAAHQAGHLPTAEALCRHILSIAPDHAAALNMLGVIAVQIGNLPAALDWMNRCIAAAPHVADYHADLGVVLQKSGQLDPAIAAYRRALSLEPGNPKALANLGNALLCHGQIDTAIDICRQAILASPNNPLAHNNLGNALAAADQWQLAADAFTRAIALSPTFLDAYTNLGNAYLSGKVWDRAIAAFTQGLALRPDFSDAHKNLASALLKQHEADASLPALDQAIQSLRRAVDLQPRAADLRVHLATALWARGDFAAAIALTRRTLEIDPRDIESHLNLGLFLLSTGDFQNGWPEYEWRWHAKRLALATPATGLPWDGSDLAGRRILLYAEQGFGDIIQLSRFIPFLPSRGEFALVCQPSLHRLFRQTWPFLQCIASSDAAIRFDVHCALMSLPRHFKTTLATIPAAPYLTPAPDSVRQWQSRLPRDSRLKVGFLWHNRPFPPNRCPPPADWSILAGVKNVWFCSLQKENPTDTPPGLDITDWTSELTDFADTAALLAGLDLIITVDTAVAHLAGALGKPVWLLLKKVPDWRWMIDRADSPWYPTMRLFRQPKIGDWQTPLAAIAAALAERET